MRKIKNISIALAFMPILFSGCVQEKVSEITPSKLKDRNITLQQKPIEKESLSSTLTLPYSTPYTLTDMSRLEPLMHMVESNLNTEIEGKDGSYSTSIEVGEDWEEITKEEEIISTATAFLGTEYIWAANGPSSFDCSGFTKYVYKEHGMTIPRYSGHQAKVGIKISFAELEKGDLVFFDTEKKFHNKVNHVGIYMGDGKFIHASSAKKRVVITNFNKKTFYKKRFLWGQRVVNSANSYASL